MMIKRLICLCEWLSGHVYIPILLALLGLTAGILLPGPVGIAAMAALTALPALTAVHGMIPRPDTPGWRLEPPSAALWTGLRHIILDRAVVTRNRLCVRHALLPFEPEPALRLRANSGALLLATAATLACEEAAPAQQSGILAALAPLGFTPERLARRSPILSPASLGNIPGVLTRDGLGRRAYFMADPIQLSQECSLIYDGGERDITQDDRERIRCAAEALRAQDETPVAFAMAAGETQPLQGVFLGILTLGDAVSPEADADMEALTRQGYHVTCGLSPDDDLTAGRARTGKEPDPPYEETLYVSARPERQEVPAACQLIPEDGSPRSCAEAIFRWADFCRRLRRMLCLTAGALIALLPSAVLLSVPWYALLLVLLLMLSGAWETRHTDAPSSSPGMPGAFRLAAYLMTPFIICLMVSLFLHAVGFAGHYASLPALMVFALFLRQRILLRRRAWRSPRSYASLIVSVLLSVSLVALLRPSAAAAVFSTLSAVGGTLIMRCLLPLRHRS